MSKKYCVYLPEIGLDLFQQAKSNFGYTIATKLHSLAVYQPFIDKYKKTLSLDAEGIPTYDSMIKNPYVKQVIGDESRIANLSKSFKPMKDTYDNYSDLLGIAYKFNTTNESKEDFTAIVETLDGNIQVKLYPKTQTIVDKFNNQYAVKILNDKLVKIFNPIGLNIGHLSDAEIRAGRVGVTDFSKVKDIALGLNNVIRIANNSEGFQALSEEASHLLVGIFKDQALVKRALASLNNVDVLKQVLQEDYVDVFNFYEGNLELVAEESLGRLLQKNFLASTTDSVIPKSLLDRVISFIKEQFKRFSSSEVENAIITADSSMSELSKKIMSSSIPITKEDLMNSQREVQLNALSNNLERDINILKDAQKNELKKYKITKNKDFKDKIQDNINNINSSLQEDSDTTLGILNYAQRAVQDLTMLNSRFNNKSNLTPKELFKLLIDSRTYAKSYGTFIKQLEEAALEEADSDTDNFETQYDIDGYQVSVNHSINELSKLSRQLEAKFTNNALEMLNEFYKPFFGEEIEVLTGNSKGEKITLNSLLKESEKDISFFDRWLDSMGDSSDVLLQLMDAVVKRAKDSARLDTIKTSKKIDALRQLSESYGITTFEWMFEKDSKGNKSGNYISEINYSQYQTDLKEFMDYLDDKYGKSTTGLQASAKLKEKQEWAAVHSFNRYNMSIPNTTYYRNKSFDSLSAKQKEILSKFLELKDIQDNKYSSKNVYNTKAIQIRKNSTQRFLDVAGSPTKLIDNLKQSLQDAWLDAEDDNQEFGNISRSTTNFSNEEFMMQPMLYINTLQDPNELSTDIFSSLLQYTYATNTYEAMEEVINPLEITKIIANSREISKTRGGNVVEEKIEGLGITAVNKVLFAQGTTNITKKIDNFLECQVYGRYMKDAGTFEVLGKHINKSKAVNNFLKASSMASQAFNFLANIANATTGLAMQNIEAAAGQYFSAKELAKADWEYKSEVMKLISDLPNRTKSNKLDLFNELFDIKQDYKGSLKRVQKKNLLERVFGTEIAFLGQAAGDHWLYNRTAIAMAIRQKVKLNNGTTTSLWEALHVRDTTEGIKEMYLPEGTTDLEGNPINIGKISRRIAHVNQGLFGIYNEEDSNAANRVIMGRLLMQYRKWMKPQFNKRFQSGQYNITMNEWEEGYYNTFIRMINQLRKGQVQISTIWESLKGSDTELKDFEVANIKRVLAEFTQFFAVWALANLVDWDDDKDRPWALKMAEYVSQRLAHELGGLTPSTTFLQENIKTFKSPIPSIRDMQNLIDLMTTCIAPSAYFDEIESGPYKGMNSFQRAVYRAPLFGISQLQNITKPINGIDDSILFYTRSY